jgi:hypothetical protein
VLVDEGFQDGGKLLLLAAGKLRSRFEKASHLAGWSGHILEQYAHNKLIRPRAEYVGLRDLPYVPIEPR